MTYITGDKALDRRLAKVAGPIAQKAVASGIRAGLGEIRKAIRSEVPIASVRKTVASRFKRIKKRGTTSAKVGGSVGKRTTSKAERTRPGVGISKQNAHWYFLGTTSRQTKSGANRGRMPANHAVALGFAKSNGAAMRVVQRKILTVLDKEAAKLR